MLELGVLDVSRYRKRRLAPTADPGRRVPSESFSAQGWPSVWDGSQPRCAGFRCRGSWAGHGHGGPSERGNSARRQLSLRMVLLPLGSISRFKRRVVPVAILPESGPMPRWDPCPFPTVGRHGRSGVEPGRRHHHSLSLETRTRYGQQVTVVSPMPFGPVHCGRHSLFPSRDYSGPE